MGKLPVFLRDLPVLHTLGAKAKEEASKHRKTVPQLHVRLSWLRAQLCLAGGWTQGGDAADGTKLGSVGRT